MPAAVKPIKGVFADGSSPVTQVSCLQPMHVGVGTDVDVRMSVVGNAGEPINLTGAMCVLGIQQYPDDTTPLDQVTGTTGPFGALPPQDGGVTWADVEALGSPSAYNGSSHPYAQHALVTANGGTWIAAAALTSAGATFPAPAVGASVADGASTWYCVTAWAEDTSYAAGNYVSSNGNVYVCAVAGVSATGVVDFAVAAAVTAISGGLGPGAWLYDVTVTFADGKVAQLVPASPLITDSAF